MIREHDSVALMRDLAAEGLVKGDVGTVVHAYEGGAAYEVEFVNYEGETIAVATLEAAAVRAVGTRDVPHVREVTA
ncbi:MAG: DUF4926 domain-containing protein [Burkholderiales bacterium]